MNRKLLLYCFCSAIVGFGIGFFVRFSVQKKNDNSSQRHKVYVKTDYCGIDVSHHQKNIDWDKVATNSAIQFVYIKATDGATWTDPNYKKNLEGAAKSFKVGAYHFFQTTSSAHAQFEHFKSVVPKGSISLIPMVDVEIDEKKSKWTYKQVGDSLQVFMNLCKAYYGKYPMIYGTQRSYNTWCASRFNNFHLYIGRYGDKEPIIKGKGRYTIWQYSEKGHIDGIDKPVDLCKFGNKHNISEILL